jgi:hypothetical protein
MSICEAIFRLVDERFPDVDNTVLVNSLICALARAIANDVRVAGNELPERKAKMRSYQKVLNSTVEGFLSSRPITTTMRQ